MTCRLAVATVAIGLAAAAGAAVPAATPAPARPVPDSCLSCHAKLTDERLRKPAELASVDIHNAQGITCAGCHGGDPAATGSSAAMDPRKGFVGVFAPRAIPDMCGSCHSNPAYMLRYSPNIPTDQLSQYRTSKHGLALAKGATDVAVCSSCHGAHGIRPPTDARSPVYPTRIVATCARCHSDVALMNRYGIKGNEVEEYKKSVHYEALTQKNDLSAPTCKSCHGAHGATPPGVDSVANVCGTCHVSQLERFDQSPHKDAFAAMDQPACEACHSNHAIEHPQDSWIGVAGKQVCGSCHAAGDAGATAAAAISGALARAVAAEASAAARVARVKRAGMFMDAAEVKLQAAHQAYIMATVEIHTVTVARVEKQTAAALADTAVADKDAAAAEREIRFRRTGLFISLAVIALAMVALIFKIRSMER